MLARLLVLAAIGFPLGSAAASPPLGLPADFRLEATGPDGGTVWTGRIPNYFMSDPRLSDVYLPPGYNPGERYPVLYLLHGFWGSPGSLFTVCTSPTRPTNRSRVVRHRRSSP